MAYALDLTEMEAAVLLSLVGLSIAVMQNDEAAGRGHVESLSMPGVEAVAKRLVEKCSALFAPLDPADEVPTLILES